MHVPRCEHFDVRISHLQLVSEDCLSVVDADYVRHHYSGALRAGELSDSSGRVPMVC